MPSNTLFVKRHYDYLGAWWKTEPLHRPAVRVALLRFTVELRRTQSNFHATRFLQACGYTRGVAETMAAQVDDAYNQANHPINQVVDTETC
jgi:hypothetical protein